jgi:hypothetical protein
MRRPRKRIDKAAPDRNPPGGRAWLRVRQFARARGLEVEPPPQAEESAAKKGKTPPSRGKK